MSRIIIAHRGNIDGPLKAEENKPKYIDAALENGFDVEVDLWLENGHFLLGHDSGQFQINDDFLLERSANLWCHAKNIDALYHLSNMPLNYFWHETDAYTLTSKNYIWAYPEKQVCENSICVMPENNDPNFELTRPLCCAGFCTDWPKVLRDLLNETS